MTIYRIYRIPVVPIRRNVLRKKPKGGEMEGIPRVLSLVIPWYGLIYVFGWGVRIRVFLIRS